MYACGKKSLLKNERDRLVSLSEKTENIYFFGTGKPAGTKK